ncbi:MAG: helix-turn-helix domain-containing protein [Acidobacteria bacterium]|nr:helix-turn-helix domain-containing protein [Acidobacteriota bacterium]
MIQGVLAGTMRRAQAAERLARSPRTIRRYVERFLSQGPEGLRDRRTSNYRKLTAGQAARIVALKQEKPHRSARWLRDHLQLPVSVEAIRLILVRHHLNRISLPPVKPVQRFVAEAPNDLWQVDLMGKVRFPLVGDLYLILALDDHSRFILAGAFFFRQFKINVFLVLYRAFVCWGLPRALLSDRGSQFQATQRHGEADYQYYAKRLGVDLVYAHRPQTKGKIERLFRFIQRDFVLEHLHLTSLDAINAAFGRWLQDYNFRHEHRGLDRECAAGLYVASPRKLTPEQLEFLLVHEEPRKVLKTGTISYYGQAYRVPDDYLGRRVWTRLKGEVLFIEAGRTVIAEYPLRHDRLDVPLTANSDLEKAASSDLE